MFTENEKARQFVHSYCDQNKDSDPLQSLEFIAKTLGETRRQSSEELQGHLVLANGLLGGGAGESEITRIANKHGFVPDPMEFALMHSQRQQRELRFQRTASTATKGLREMGRAFGHNLNHSKKA